METLRKLLDEECGYRMADETMDSFLGLMTEVRLKNKEAMIPSGKMDNSIYVVKEGIIRYAYFNGMKETTYAFAAPGTMVIAYHSFSMHYPSYFNYESCGPSVVMRVAKADFDELFQQSKDFANWAYKMSTCQLFSYEMKVAVINGTARDRFEALLNNRPEILKRVSNRIIASYIGVSQSYLSHLKRRILSKSVK